MNQAPVSAAQLRQHAERLMAAGQYAAAADAYTHLLTLAPHSADCAYNLGWLQERLHRPDAALAAYDEALRLGIEGAEEVHLNRAVLLADALAQPEAARQALQQALAIQSGYVPAWLNLGNLHEQMGERAQAVQAYETALRFAPGHALALARLCSLMTDPVCAAPWVAQVQQALAEPRRTAAERADLGFALGKALDLAGRHDDAFVAYVAANSASADMAPQSVYRPEAAQQLVDRIIEQSSQVWPALPPAEGPQLIFICGMFRSGSSLAEQILASHPAVTPAGELDTLPRLAAQLLSSASPPTAGQLLEARASYLRALALAHPTARVVTDKRIDNFQHLGLIRALFPSAKIVHTRRGPLDNGLALFFLHLGPTMPWARSLADIGHWYGLYHRLMQHWQRQANSELHPLDYDALVQAPEPHIRALLSHCGLPWDARCLQPQHTQTQVKTPSAWQVRQPIYTGSLGRWRHYERHLSPLRQALGALA